MDKKRKKTGGRTAGTPNKLTGDMRQALKTFLETQRPEFEKAFKGLSKKEKVRSYVRLLPFVTPQFQSISMDIGNWSEDQLLVFENYLKQKYAAADQQTGTNQED